MNGTKTNCRKAQARTRRPRPLHPLAMSLALLTSAIGATLLQVALGSPMMA